MKTFIALFRGINIGGHHLLPMKALTAILQDLGATEVTTYIQSGNAVFRSPSRNPDTLAKRLNNRGQTTVLHDRNIGFRSCLLPQKARPDLETAVCRL
jgi:uncharacterized protein (DUF1697 family)